MAGTTEEKGRSVTLQFYKASEKAPHIQEDDAYIESPLCLFRTTYGSYIIGKVRPDFMGYLRVWTGYMDATLSFTKDIDEWAYATELN